MPGNDAPFKSKSTQLVVGHESSQNTTVAPDRVPGLVADAASLPDPEVDYLEDRVIGGDRELFDKRAGRRTYEAGSITVRPQDAWPFAYLFGSETVNADTDIDGNSETGTDTHVFTPLMDDLPPTFTTEAVYYAPTSSSANDFVRTFGGCAVASGEITMDNENQLEVDLDLYAMSVSPGSSPTSGISVPDQEKWIFSDAKSNLNLFGTSFARVTDFSVSMDNGLEAKYYIESANAPDPFELLYNIIEYQLDCTIAVDDNTLYNQLVNNTDTTFTAEITFERPNGDALRIKATECQIESAPHEIPEDDQTIEVDVSIVPEGLEVRVEDSNTADGTAILA
ncbi:tail tube [Halovirus HCTV-5]|uniref:tail tube n=1 Tax=Halovirus HCTV-5 TaxID=1273748 RepID=UPI0003348A27|nr:tail tube [Halovirus HCTV-5]AGM11733.1 tail tube [Halovirus HCTV-5]